MIIDVSRDLLRAYILYLSEDVIVSPNKSFEIKVLGKRYVFIEGEESILPRWFALILQDRNLVKIKDDQDNKSLISDAIQLAKRESLSPSLLNVNNLLTKLKEYLQRESNERFKENAYSVLKKLVDSRIIKILTLAMKSEELSGEERNLDPLELVFFIRAKNFIKEWYDNTLEGNLEEVI